MLVVKELIALIFDHFKETKSLCLLRGINRHYAQLHRNELLCAKLNKQINIECMANPGYNFSTRMKAELKRDQDETALYLCMISYNRLNLKRVHETKFFYPVNFIHPIKETTLISRKKINTIHGKYNISRIEWQNDGRLGFYNYETDELSFNIHTIISRIREIEYGIRCIAVILIEGEYTLAHCVIDPITATILEIYELKTGFYLKKKKEKKLSHCIIL